jgi:hypothetical protein
VRRIRENIFSYLPRDKKRGGPTWTTVQEVRASKGYRIQSYEEAVAVVAHLASEHRGSMLFFRGQTSDHHDRAGRTNLYSTLFRSPRGKVMLTAEELERRGRELDKRVASVLRHRRVLGLPGRSHRHIETAIALIQHYGLAPTPLLDVTLSLRVAASFALPSRDAQLGVVYVLALPYPTATISHFTDLDMVLVRLSAICPFDAKRPHFQDGWLVGKYPIVNASKPTVAKERKDNAAGRLVAKLIVDNRLGRFFGPGFPRIPTSALLPVQDQFRDRLMRSLALPC